MPLHSARSYLVLIPAIDQIGQCVKHLYTMGEVRIRTQGDLKAAAGCPYFSWTMTKAQLHEYWRQVALALPMSTDVIIPAFMPSSLSEDLLPIVHLAHNMGSVVWTWSYSRGVLCRYGETCPE